MALRTWGPIQLGVLKINKNGWNPLSARRNVRVLSQPLRHQNELGFKTEGRDPIFGQHSYLPLRTQDVICGEIRTLWNPLKTYPFLMSGGQHHCFANIVASSLAHGLRCQWPLAHGLHCQWPAASGQLLEWARRQTCASSWTRRDLPPVASCFPMPPLLYALLTRGPFANDGLLLPLAALTSLTVRLGGRGASAHLRLVDSSRLAASGRLL